MEQDGSASHESQVHCPVSGNRGRLVAEVTLRALLKPEQQERISAGPYRFCDAKGCDVVYFSEDGSQVFRIDDVTVRVGVKETAAPRPVCYCFGYSAEDILEEVRRIGRSTIPEVIKERLDIEGCNCEQTNPQGSCCLGVVSRFAREALELNGS